MLPEVADAIRIAEEHLKGAPPEKQKALALAIQEAIVRHAGDLATHSINEAFRMQREQSEKRH